VHQQIFIIIDTEEACDRSKLTGKHFTSILKIVTAKLTPGSDALKKGDQQNLLPSKLNVTFFPALQYKLCKSLASPYFVKCQRTKPSAVTFTSHLR